MLLLAWAGAIACWSPPAAAAEYFVRVDGGDAGQCDGRHDAPWRPTVGGRECAWRHPFDALPPGGSARIAGGDTLHVGAGSYRMGAGAPGTDALQACDDDWRWDCHMPPIPSGAGPEAPTRILGAGADRGCALPPQLWGAERAAMVLNLQGSRHVEIACLAVTDRSDCVEAHADPAARCRREAVPHGDWASVGILARDSRDVLLRDLDVHGMAHTGLRAGGLRDWMLLRVRLRGNGWAGWDGDVGEGSSNDGAIVLRQVEIAWNGCGQRWPSGAYWACWAQQAGGYGDGLGTARTGGRWLLEDVDVYRNTSDGIDLLYLDGAPGTSVTVRRARIADNAGNQLKTFGNAVVEDTLVVGRCGAFAGRDAMVDGDHCRAMGNALSLGLGEGHRVAVRRSTITGEGDCLLLTSGGDASSRVDIESSVLVGQPEFGAAAERSCAHYADASAARVTMNGNLLWGVKPAPCPAGNTCDIDPGLHAGGIAGFDGAPGAHSPLRRAGSAAYGRGAPPAVTRRPAHD